MRVDKAGCSYYSCNPIDSPAPGLEIVSYVGEMSEWSKEAVLKTVEARVSEGSNPPLSGLDKFFFSWRGARVAESGSLLRS
jgi:hypothetical protein